MATLISSNLNSSRSSARLRGLLTFAAVLGLSGCGGSAPGVAGLLVQHAPSRLVDAFLTSDQQGRAWLEAGAPERAAAHFRDPLWRGIALEAAGDFATAAFAFAQVDTATASLRRGNVLARLERLSDAADAYRMALTLDPALAEAAFNLDWVLGLRVVDAKEYEDFGGTGGQLEADEIVFDDRASDAVGEMTIDEARAQGLSDSELREMWMRRVQTTPGDFLRLKFSYHAQANDEAKTP
ncbi:MAG: Ca-activated chloride channel family protein [Myxococcota bacterium]|jgi:Ca-activated chloride channel family protein